LGAMLAKKVGMPNKTNHQSRINEIDADLRRLQGLIEQRELFVNNVMADKHNRQKEQYIEEAEKVSLDHQKEEESLKKEKATNKHERKVRKQQDNIKEREEEILKLEHKIRVDKLNSNIADPNYKSVDDLKHEADLAKAKFELMVEQNKLDEIMGVRINGHALLKKQTEEADLKAKLAQSEYDLTVAEAKKNNALNPDPNKSLLAEITKAELDGKLATAKATAATTEFLAKQQAKPEKSQGAISLIGRKATMVENHVAELHRERARITAKQNYIHDKASTDRVVAIDKEIATLWNDYNNLISRLEN